MPRYFAHIAYKGTAFHGWQIQPNAETVQERLNEAIKILAKEDVESIGCGRTDTGVHATQFFAHFDLQSQIADTTQFTFQLNALLSLDIRVYDIIAVENEAHARFDATKRSYSYYILLEGDPFLNDYAWHFNRVLDINSMNIAAQRCLQQTNFACFSKSGGQQLTTNCQLLDCRWLPEGKMLRFTVTSNRFLRGMVRAMVGTFIEVGLKKITHSDFESILISGDRKLAGQAVPAKGLFLEEIVYPYINANRKFPFKT